MGISTSMSQALSSFAHLGARGRTQDDGEDKPGERDREDRTSRRSRRAEDDNDRPDAQDDEDHDNRAADDDGEDNDKPDDDSGKSRRSSKARRARAQDEEDDKPDDDSGKGKRSRKAKRAEDAQDEGEDDQAEDDDESEMRGDSSAASARRREQARCAAIFATRAAARNPVLAAQLAFKTRLPRDEAIAMLEATPACAAPVTERAARNPNVGPGGSPEQNSRQAIAAAWDRAFAKVNLRVH